MDQEFLHLSLIQIGDEETDLADPMMTLLESKIKLGDVAGFDAWLMKQPTRQILRLLPQTRIRSMSTRPLTIFPNVFAVVHFLSEQGSGNIEDHLESILSTYLQAGCDLNAVCDHFPPSTRSRVGFTPLLLAIEQRKVRVAGVLIKLGARVDISDKAGYSPLHWAALTSSSIPLMKCLLDAGGQIGGSTTNPDGQGPHPVLHVAVDEGRVEIVNYLLGYGVDVNTSSIYKILQERYWDKLESRYDCGDLDKYRENVGITAVGRAVRMRKLDVLSLLLRHPHVQVSLADLHYTILEGDVQTANIIIGKIPPSLLAKDKILGTQIWTLHLLGKKAFEDTNTAETVKLVKTYISHGFDVNSVSYEPEFHLNRSNMTRSRPLSLLLVASNMSPTSLKLIQSLLELGADPFLPLGDTTTTAYSIAVDAGNLDIVKVFLLLNPNTWKLESRLKCLDDILLMSLDEGSGLKIKSELVQLVKTFFLPHVGIKEKHLLLAMQGFNELLVLFILQNLENPEGPGVESIFQQTNSKMEKGRPHLENFIFERIISPKDSSSDISVESILQIITGFLSRGYQLKEGKDDVLPLVNSVTHASLKTSFMKLPQSSVLFDELALLPGINWSLRSPTSRSMPNLCPSPSPLHILLRQIAHCTIRTPPVRFLAQMPKSYPLWDGDCCGHPPHDYYAPARGPCHLVDTNKRGLEMLEKLLDKGVSARGVLLENLLRTHKCLIRNWSLVKKLWWAGGEVHFVTLSYLYDDETLAKHGGQRLVKDFRDWVRVGGGGGKVDLSLQRLAVIKIRDSLQYQNLQELADGCSVMPPKLLKHLITTPQD